MMMECGAPGGLGGSGKVAAKWETFSRVRTSAAVRKAWLPGGTERREGGGGAVVGGGWRVVE